MRFPVTPQQLGEGITWLERAWRNSPSIPWDVRANFLKIGFESLLGVDGRWKQAKALRRRFELLAAMFDGGFDDRVWSPDESESRTVRSYESEQECTDLQHWYETFYRHRNSTEHPKAEPVGPLYEEGSRFDGPIFQIGERVLRDLLRAELSLATGERIYASTLHRAIVRSLREMEGD